MRPAILSVAGCLLAGLTAADPALATAARDIENWNTICSSGLTCSLSYVDLGETPLGTVTFRRTGASRVDIELRLPRPPRFSRNLDPGGVFRFAVDGKEVLNLPVRQLKSDADQDGDLVAMDQASVGSLIEAMKAGASLQLSYQGVAGKYASEIKLEGFRPSLYFIDDVQGRRGRRDALFAIGQAVPEGPGSKDIRSLDDIPASIRADFTAEGGSCAGGVGPDDMKRYNGFDISLSGTRLVLVPCDNGGAYNTSYALYLGYYDGALFRASFPDVEEGKPSISAVAYNVDFDPVTRIMTSFLKDNGMGACGLWHKWQLTEAGTLVLLERRGWYECDDSYDGPESFPLEWPVDPPK